MKNALLLLGCLMLGCGGGSIQLPASMIIDHQTKQTTTATYSPIAGPGWKLDLDQRWHSVSPSPFDDGMTHLNIEQEPVSGSLFEEAMKKRQGMLHSGVAWRISKDHMPSNSGLSYYQFQASEVDGIKWITLFVADGKMTVVECGGLASDAEHNQIVCDELIRHFQPSK